MRHPFAVPTNIPAHFSSPTGINSQDGLESCETHADKLNSPRRGRNKSAQGNALGIEGRM
jgi:hypothetical protein